MSSDPTSGRTHLVIIPSYNSGERLLETVRSTLIQWPEVLVVIDGSTDGSDRELHDLKKLFPQLQLLSLPDNRGKGAAVLAGMQMGLQAGFKFCLVMDSDGQHPAASIAPFMEASRSNPHAMILGVPVFGPEAPKVRMHGHVIANFWTNLETLWGGIDDSLFGFRIYPIDPSVEILTRLMGGKGYDFDTQLAVRLYWRGYQPMNIPVPVQYFAKSDGGVSHFNYLRDNLLLIWTHAQLLVQMPLRIAFRKSLAPEAGHRKI